MISKDFEKPQLEQVLSIRGTPSSALDTIRTLQETVGMRTSLQDLQMFRLTRIQSNQSDLFVNKYFLRYLLDESTRTMALFLTFS